MKFGFALFARFGLFARKTAGAPDLFDLRLERSRAREHRCIGRAVLFKSRQLPLEA